MESGSNPSARDLKLEIQELKQAQAVAEATNAGAHSTQAAVQAGDTAAQTATHVGSTVMAGVVAFIVGVFVTLAFVAVAKD